MKGIRHLVLMVVCMATTWGVRADEGMWIPMLLKQLNESQMQASGLKLTAEDIYSINKSSLKDAVVHFGGGCTSGIISGSGLLLTNHHCGYGQIQSHSTLEHDYLQDGFWAKTRADELPNEGLTATIIVRMEDVTKAVLKGITDDMDETVRADSIESNMERIIEEATKDTHYEAYIRPFYHGNDYYMFITEVFKDVRLVGAPPSSIGKFGFDTDNWVWPRHNADFSIFRIYADKDNKPAEYSEGNVPYKPKHFFPISLKGIQQDDFTMVYGFPGRTSEYLPSQAVNYTLNVSNPAKIEMRKKSLSIIDAAMRSDKKINIQYAAKQSRISNAYKKWIGQNKGLVRLNALRQKQVTERKFLIEARKKEETRKKYGSLLTEYAQAYDELEPYALARDYFIEAVFYGPEILRFANRFDRLISLTLEKAPEEDRMEAMKEVQEQASQFFKNYHQPTDERIFSALMSIYHEGVSPDLRPDMMNAIMYKYKSYDAYAKVLYGKTIFTNEEKLTAMLQDFKAGHAKKLRKDPAYQLMANVYNGYYEKVKPKYDEINANLSKANRLYMEGLMELLPKAKVYYPDANGTLRVAYGKVDGYVPQDGADYSFSTTLSGVMEKYEPGSYEFDVPEKLRDLYARKDYGRYGKDGKMPVCFTASNHTTGGNSGSPVLDGDGNLIGLNFDRAWESTMSDIIYDASICRNIMVDARYLLFIIDKFAGASHLVDEMKLVE